MQESHFELRRPRYRNPNLNPDPTPTLALPLLLQSLRAEAEKAAAALREDLDKSQRAAAKHAAEDAAAHEAEVARLTAEHERAQVAVNHCRRFEHRQTARTCTVRYWQLALILRLCCLLNAAPIVCRHRGKRRAPNVTVRLQATQSNALSTAHANAEALRVSLAAAESAAKERAAAAEASSEREAELREKVQALEANLSARPSVLPRAPSELLAAFIAALT